MNTQDEIKLNFCSFNNSRNYLFRYCRRLEQVRFCCLFENLNHDSVLEEIAKYQNNDGGFGHGLEPDLRTKNSSSLCTSVALQILHEINTSKKHKIINTTLEYLTKTFDQNTRSWRIIPKRAQSEPHAPWWSQTDNIEKYTVFNLNPTSEIVSYFVNYDNNDYNEFTKKNLENIKKEIFNKKEIGMHDYLCLMRLYKNYIFEDHFKNTLKEFIFDKLLKVTELNPVNWGNYSLQPVQIADSPKSEFYPILKKYIPLNLKHIIDSQNHDGSWTPTWSWGEYHENSWKIALEEWKGVLIYENLKILKIYDMVRGFNS